MSNETIAVGVPTKIYLDLSFHLRKQGDLRNPDEVVALAIRHWMAGRNGMRGAGGSRGHGYQWQEVFLPEGTQLRMRYRGTWYYANVVRDRLVYAGESVSPREWGLLVTGGVRNAWRDAWLRRSATECWTRASAWRDQAKKPWLPGAERRTQARRCTD